MITIINQQKTIIITPLRARTIKKAISKTCSLKKFYAAYSKEITLSFVSDRLITSLNRRYLKKNIPTDVIAFDLSNEKNRLLADIVVSVDTARRNARIYGTDMFYEVLLYCVHGMLHILGYDDNTIKNRKIMRKKEAAIFNSLRLTYEL